MNVKHNAQSVVLFLCRFILTEVLTSVYIKCIMYI